MILLSLIATAVADEKITKAAERFDVSAKESQKQIEQTVVTVSKDMEIIATRFGKHADKWLRLKAEAAAVAAEKSVPQVIDAAAEQQRANAKLTALALQAGRDLADSVVPK